MIRKLSLELDTLSVESFATEGGAPSAPGTVRGAEDESAAPNYFDCTCFHSCVCPSAYYWCGDGYHTIYSCNYTNNESCAISSACTTS